MLTFLQLGNYGRLGNQLFQYAALKTACLHNNLECKIPNFTNRSWHGQNCLLNNFNLECDFLNQKDYQKINKTINQPCESTFYCNVLENLEDNINLHGFFIHKKYFSKFEKQIIKELTPKKEILDKELIILDKIKQKGYETISLHLRLGDSVDGTNPDIGKHYGESPFDIGTTVGSYLVKSLEHFSSKKTKIIVFVGGSRTGNDDYYINWAKKYFSDKKFIVSETNDPIRDFSLISHCDHNILSFSSTYSLWSAYINPNPEKIVICPKDFFFDGKMHDRHDFFDKKWIQI